MAVEEEYEGDEDEGGSGQDVGERKRCMEAWLGQQRPPAVERHSSELTTTRRRRRRRRSEGSWRMLPTYTPNRKGQGRTYVFARTHKFGKTKERVHLFPTYYRFFLFFSIFYEVRGISIIIYAFLRV